MSDEGFLQKRIEAQAARIEALEAALRLEEVGAQAMHRQAAARIEALEAALRDIININHSTHYNIGKIARAALAPEQDR